MNNTTSYIAEKSRFVQSHTINKHTNRMANIGTIGCKMDRIDQIGHFMELVPDIIINPAYITHFDRSRF